ncbi:hypothetical protein [Acinetobacter radioresistens]|uniref:hypothetical protein n=1 Tax=Acinetobacter radioresistens TaxID=40216 RepID=UPI00200660C6|nr:hypothetical protein [Acinetobacter radioresistens]MCK4107889.1 lysozyme inhibitor [Acinetobacter radioresistens]
MKYPLLGAVLIGLTITGCTSNPNTEVLQEKVKDKDNVSSNAQIIEFTGPNGLLIFLKSSDNFETAVMTDNSGKVYRLQRAVSGSGVRLANNQGVSIHFKAGEGIVEFIKDQPISITEHKK